MKVIRDHIHPFNHIESKNLGISLPTGLYVTILQTVRVIRVNVTHTRLYGFQAMKV